MNGRTARRAAWGAALLVALAGGVLYPRPPWAPPPPPDTAADAQVDLGLYRAVVDRLHHGEPYHDALGAELRARSFPVRPVFNWRTPLHLSLLGALPSLGWAVALYLALAAAAVAPWARHLDRQGPAALGVGLVALLAAFLPFANTSGVLFSEVWCGTWLLLALGLRAEGLPGASVAPALLALFFRELAAPWLVVMTLQDLAARRWKVVAGWAAGACAYAAWFGWHAWRVAAELGPDDTAVRSWVAGGGPRFVLDTLAFFTPTALLPRLAPAVLVASLAVALSNLRGPRSSLGVGLLVWTAWLLVFGQPFDTYWGCVAIPSVAASLALLPDGVRRAWRA